MFTTIWAWIRAHWRALGIFLGCVIIGVILYNVAIWLQERAFNKGVDTQKAIAEQKTKEAQASTAIANEYAKKFEDSNKENIKLKEDIKIKDAQREAMEAIFKDASKTFAEKDAAFQSIKNAPIPVTPNGADYRSLCERAKRHGIKPPSVCNAER